ncbi:maintenance of mitochondrial morphology protein 1 [Scheffersomyces xylosifermentans]|uniref:maintenance of mitochondrial morphology protein 1 n=1 Tax=Scheffersomyces xylosifermentans TaxID=1304137 RepID=UPI00315D9F6C
MSTDLIETEVDVSKSQHQQQNLHHLEQLQEQLKIQQEELFQQQRALLLHESNLVINSPLQMQQSSQSQSNTWSFTQGLIIGQLSVIFVIIIFIKFFVFAESTPSSAKTTIKKDASGVIVRRDKKSGSNDDDSDLTAREGNSQGANTKVATILEKTYYDVDNHSPESLDWFNVLVAQTISQLRAEALLSDNIYHSLNEFLLKSDLPEYLDKINLTEIDIGDDFPIFSNCRIKHSKDGSGRLEAKIDVDLSDTLTLGIETKLVLNHPRPLTAVLPVQLSVSMVRFSGCLTVSLINTSDQEFVDLKSSSSNSEKSTPEPAVSNSSPHLGSPLAAEPVNASSIPLSGSNSVESEKKPRKVDDDNDGTALMFSFSPDYRLEFTVKSLIGSRAKLQDVPKISSIIENRLRSWFIERCIEPRFQVVRLPSLWPRRKNTREPVHANKSGIVDVVEDVSG